MARKKHLINVHTSTGTTAPTNASLYLGEIAVQHTPNDPALWIKMGSSESSTEYEKFIGKTEILNLIQASNILGSGYTYSGISYVNSATTIADAYSALTRELIDDKLVTTSALNDLNVRLDAICGATHDISSLYDRVASAETVIQQDEETIAGALNDLNVRVGTVETQMTGDYIPITGYMTATGVTEEELTLTEEDTVNEALGKLQKQMLDNEESIAAGLNDLNTRLENVDDIIAHNTGVTQLSGAVRSFSAATDYEFEEVWFSLSQKANDSEFRNVSGATRALSGAVMGISAKTSGVLTVNLNGVLQGRYSPSASTTINLTAATEVTGADVLLTGYELATGTTEEELAIVATDTVNEAFGKIQKQNYDNEAVTAGAINDLDERLTILEVSGGGEGAVTGVTVNGTGNAITNATYGSSALTLTKGNVLTAETLTGVSAGGTNLTVTNKIAAIPSASSSTFGVVKTGNFITNTNGSIAVTTGTNATSVARGDHSHSGYATTGTLNTHTAVTIANGTSSQMHLPTVSASDNGKILRVVNGAWALVDPATIYSGSTAPA